MNLTHLNLAHNSLIDIPTQAFVYISSSLKELDLRGNNLQQLQKDSFPKNMSQMTQINFEACMLSFIHELAFEGMPKIETLVFKDNRLKTVPPAVSSLVNLNILDLSYNHVEDSHIPFEFEIKPNTFANLSKMKILILSNTAVRSLKRGMFNGMIKLNMLLMGDCELTSIEDKTFNGLQGLRVLELKQNPNLKGLNANTFYGLGLLSTLYLDSIGYSLPTRSLEIQEESDISRNLLSIQENHKIDFVTIGQVVNQKIRDSSSDNPDLTLRPFYYLNRLEFLYITKNNIGDLYPEVFADMPLLHLLDLGDNRIRSWETPMFLNNSVLQELYLYQNQITSVSEAMLEDFQSVRTNIDLTKNPFLCDFGTCCLKNESESNLFRLTEWEDPSLYTCVMTEGTQKGETVFITSLSQEFCQSQDPTAETPAITTSTNVPFPDSSSSSAFAGSSTPFQDERSEDESGDSGTPALKTAIILVSIGTCVIVLGVFGYTKRVHLKYFLFVVRLNFKNIPLRKVRTSELIDHEGYDFDVFISYSHYDNEFIQDRLVPELEGNGKFIDKLLEDNDSGFSNSAIIDMDDATSTSSGSSESSTESNLKVCLHERDFEVGTPITENIIECVDRSRKIIVVVSKKYLESQWCLFEMNLAYHRLVEARRKSFVVILLEEIPLGSRTKVLNYLMRSRTYLEWPRSDSQQSPSTEQEQKLFWKRLKRSLASDD